MCDDSIEFSEDEYLFMANCNIAEFHNFLFVWRKSKDDDIDG